MALPEWIDATFSSELPVLRDRGEGQHLEFMLSYPQNAHELGKEIAAFSSSNAGLIIIGVADDGTCVGIEGMDDALERDKLRRRLEGLCTNAIKPAITPVLKFGSEDGRIVLGIEVPKGGQPLYYSNSKPYIRHLSQSRPAEPHEVVERVEAWLSTRPSAPSGEDEYQQQFFTTLAALLVELLIHGDEFDERNVNPWLDLARVQMGGVAQQLRELAASDIADRESIVTDLHEIADELDAVSAHRLTMGGGSWATLTGHVNTAVEKARELKARTIDTAPLSPASRKEIKDVLLRTTRQLIDLDRRADTLIESGKIEDLQADASQFGFLLLRIASYDLSFLGDDFAARLRAIARPLHLLETQRLYMDGGQSMRRIAETLHALTGQLEELVSSVE